MSLVGIQQKATTKVIGFYLSATNVRIGNLIWEECDLRTYSSKI